jgi:NitT/TauT family transport system substrate-binding protein
MIKSDKPAAISRRNILRGAGAVGVAATSGAFGAAVFSPAIAGPAPKIRLGWGDVAACHSPLGFGVAKGIYAKHNLDIELYPFTSNGQTVIQALATGKADVAAGLLGDWLKPLEQGFDVKLFVGSHGGCGRLFASEKSEIKDLKDLKGKTIATFVMGASPQTVLQVSIFKAGVDPNADVTWKVVPFDLVGETVARGEADAGIHIDPWAWSIEKKNNLIHIADTQTGLLRGPHLLRARRQWPVSPSQQGRAAPTRRSEHRSARIYRQPPRRSGEVVRRESQTGGADRGGSHRNPRRARLPQPSGR